MSFHFPFEGCDLEREVTASRGSQPTPNPLSVAVGGPSALSKVKLPSGALAVFVHRLKGIAFNPEPGIPKLTQVP